MEMTPFEYLEIANNNFQTANHFFQFAVTGWFGYLVAAMSVGSQLSRLQVSMLNFLFVIFCGWCVMGGYTAATNGFAMANSGREALGLVEFSRISFGLVIVPFQVTVMVVCISFMWSVRNSKKE